MKTYKGFGNHDYQGTSYSIDGKSKKIISGSVHPEIGILRLKYLKKDIKLFNKYGVSQFYRDPYKNELDLYPYEAFNHIKGGKSCCNLICCMRVNNQTRAAIPTTYEKTFKDESYEH